MNTMNKFSNITDSKLSYCIISDSKTLLIALNPQCYFGWDLGMEQSSANISGKKLCDVEGIINSNLCVLSSIFFTISIDSDFIHHS